MNVAIRSPNKVGGPIFLGKPALEPKFWNQFLFWETHVEQGRKGTLPNIERPYSYVLTALSMAENIAGSH